MLSLPIWSIIQFISTPCSRKLVSCDLNIGQRRPNHKIPLNNSNFTKEHSLSIQNDKGYTLLHTFKEFMKICSYIT